MAIQKTKKLDLDAALAAYEAGAQPTRALRPANIAGKAAAYTAAAGAALALAPSADAALDLRDIADVTITGGASTVATFIDVDGDLVDDFRFQIGPSGFSVWADVANATGGRGWVTGGPTSAPARLNWLDPVSAGNVNTSPPIPDLRFANADNTIGGNWAGDTMSLGGAGFLGVAIDVGGQTHYGWIRLGIDNDETAGGRPIALTIYQVAWETDADTPIQIPEPGSASALALLAAGAVGVSAWRRRRKAAQPAA